MQNFKSTPDSLKQIFEAFGRKSSLGAPDGGAVFIYVAQLRFPLIGERQP